MTGFLKLYKVSFNSGWHIEVPNIPWEDHLTSPDCSFISSEMGGKLKSSLTQKFHMIIFEWIKEF